VHRRQAITLFVMVLIGTAILLPIALVIHWFPADASKQAHNDRILYDVLLIASVPIFVIVESVVLYSVWNFRMRPGEEEKDGPPIHGNTRLEVVWTAAPALLIVGLCIYAYTVLRSNEKTYSTARLINVTERQFAFEFSYPEDHGKQYVVSPDLYLPDNQPVLFQIRSLDVIHSFFVPNFSQKIDAVPGITTMLRVTPTRLGTYPVECTELCGAGHAFMRSAVHVLTPAAFNSWLAAQKPGGPAPVGTPGPTEIQPGVPGAPTSASSPGSSSSSTIASSSPTTASSGASTAGAGKAVFTSAGCSACHTLAAAGATGTIGPNLDMRLKSDCAAAASKRLRGATLTACIHTAITDPYKYIPSGFRAGIMPPTFAKTLSATQLQAVVSFLATMAK
jgi:cytochrome c oxidase subunit 2